MDDLKWCIYICRDVDYDEKRVNSIRRIDFAWAVEREDPSKKRKAEGSSAKEGAKSSQQQWQWQSLVENLQLAHQELSVIIDLISTVSYISSYCYFWTPITVGLVFIRCVSVSLMHLWV